MERLNFPVKFSATDAGVFSGYASLTTPDREGDVIEPFAFKRFEHTADGRVVVLWQHDPASPIGLAKVNQDEKGLQFDASLLMTDPIAQRALGHMRAGTVRGMSIGFDILSGGAEFREGRRHLKQLHLYEISLVTFPMHPNAQVTAVKTRTELEDVAREVLGLTKAKARRFAHVGWPVITGEEEQFEGVDPDQLAKITEIIKSTNQILKG